MKRNGRVDVEPPTALGVDTLTVDQLLEQFIARHVAMSSRERSLGNGRCAQRVITRTELELPTGERRRFGGWLVRDVTADAIGKFKAVRTVQAAISVTDEYGRKRTRRVGRIVGANRNLSFLRAAFNWGLRKRVLDFLTEARSATRGRSPSRCIPRWSVGAVSRATKPRTPRACPM